jgi:hypothetical protein
MTNDTYIESIRKKINENRTYEQSYYGKAVSRQGHGTGNGKKLISCLKIKF